MGMMSRLGLTFLFGAVVMDMPAGTLVKDGTPNASIITDANASRAAQFAALELQYHVEKITGAKLPIVEDPAHSKGGRILVGDSQAARDAGINSADFGHQEYMIRAKDDVVILVGKDQATEGKVDYQDEKTFPDRWEECGSCHAVYDFLERLGVRWYLPTELGVTFTPSTTLEFPAIDARRAPFMKYRDPFSDAGIPIDFAGDTVKTADIPSLPSREVKLWNLRQRTGGDRIRINHSFYTYYKRFWPARPALFAQGYDGKPPQLCYSNPETLKQVIQDARDYFDGKLDSAAAFSNVPPGFKSDVFPVFPMDNSSWCKCPQCQAMLKPKAEKGVGQFSNDKASDYIFGFVNKVAREIAKSHPGKFIGSGTYHEFCYPPKELEPNVMVILCLHSRLVYAPDIMKNDHSILDAWKSAFPNTKKIIWMYYCFPALEGRQQQYRSFPGFFANHIKKNIAEFANAGVHGLFYEPSYMLNNQQNLLMDQLEGYITWRLADNPELDAKTLFSEFFGRYYGPAAEPMREFYLLVEKIFCDSANYPPGTKHQTEEIAWKDLGNSERMESLSRLMEQARQMAVADPFKKRVDVFDKGIWQRMQKGRKTYLERAALMEPTMQQAQAARITTPEPGNPLKVPWDKASQLNVQYGGLKAEKLECQLSVKMAHDGQYLYLLYEQKEVDTGKLVTESTVWESDEWESYFARQRGEPYHLLGINAAGRHDALNFGGTVRDAWEFKGKIVPVLAEKEWKTYVAIPLDDIVTGSIKPGETLYFNFIRSSRCKPLGCWIPTFAGYHAPSRFGEVCLEK